MNQKIKLLTKENPKREGSAARERFSLYRTGMTIEEFFAAGGTPADVMWDLTRQYITLR